MTVALARFCKILGGHFLNKENIVIESLSHTKILSTPLILQIPQQLISLTNTPHFFSTYKWENGVTEALTGEKFCDHMFTQK